MSGVGNISSFTLPTNQNERWIQSDAGTNSLIASTFPDSQEARPRPLATNRCVGGKEARKTAAVRDERTQVFLRLVRTGTNKHHFVEFDEVAGEKKWESSTSIVESPLEAV